MMKIATLGPSGTNSEKATRFYVESCLDGDFDLVFFEDLKTAFELLLNGECKFCVIPSIYPSLSDYIFENIDTVEMHDSFINETFPIVIAKKSGTDLKDVKTVSLVEVTKALLAKEDGLPSGVEVVLKNSNPLAAQACASGETDAVVTNLSSAELSGLEIVRNFDPLKMNWIVFGLR